MTRSLCELRSAEAGASPHGDPTPTLYRWATGLCSARDALPVSATLVLPLQLHEARAG